MELFFNDPGLPTNTHVWRMEKKNNSKTHVQSNLGAYTKQDQFLALKD